MKLYEKYQINQEHESKLALPNELYPLLLEWKNEKKIKSAHIPFVWSYLYFETWMYRYSKYDLHVPTTSEVKEILGYTPTNKTLDYIIKKDGVLDESGLTESTSDFPIQSLFQDDEENKTDRVVIRTLNSFKFDDFNFVHEWKKWNKIKLNQTIKYPVFAFERNILTPDEPDKYSDEDENGTFFDSSNTTIIDFSIFDFCMAHEDLGCTGFYLYSYLKHKNDLHKFGYDASHKRIAKELGLSEKTVQTYRNALRSHNMMELEHNMDVFYPSMPADERMVSTNKIKSFTEFANDKVEYTKFNDYKKRGKEEIYNNINKKMKESNPNHTPIEIDFDLLPF